MRWAAPVAMFVAALWLPLGCSSETANKNTNWLVTCSSSADCGGASCVCGMCTVSCSAADACTASAGVCASSFAATTQCSGQVNAGICMAACTQESDCDASRTCVAGACVTRESPSCPAHPSALACSGFDDPAQPSWTASVDAGNELSVVSTPRLAGSGALVSRTTTSGSRSRFAHEFSAMSSGQLYFRGWFYVAPGTLLTDVHTIVIGDANTGDYGTKFVYAAGKVHVAAAGAAVTGSADTPFGQWYCLRMELGIGSQGSVRAYLNDALFTDATGVNTLPAAGVHNVTAGIDFAGQADPAEVFIDELVLDTMPVGCWD
ncbi:MAG TPA: hypothetical protein VNW92_01940 [Polyangiaceae bacterium]|jgi:hypothetical protein|nr:hypothetical protein [Polyangiaceae bacterium]